jgi:hypothetical protein
MKKIQVHDVLFAAVAIMIAYLLFQNYTLNRELAAFKLQLLKTNQVVVNRSTEFLGQEAHTYRVKAKLRRENGEIVEIPLFQTTTGHVSGDDVAEVSLHLVEHLSEDNTKYYRIREEHDTGWSWTPRWTRLEEPEEYDLGEDEWDMIVEMLFLRDLWEDGDESLTHWTGTGKGALESPASRELVGLSF